MAIFCPLYSGSSGNSTYLDAGESALLIDLGVSCRAAVFLQRAKRLGLFDFRLILAFDRVVHAFHGDKRLFLSL